MASRPRTVVPHAGEGALWSQKQPGLLTDLNLSRDGSSLLVALIPDPEQTRTEGSPYRVRLLDASGKLVWERPVPAPVKSQTVSPDGDLALIAHYDQELVAINRKGAQLWAVEASCRPTLLSSFGQIVCFHDDDAEPGTAFEVFDLQGKRTQRYAITGDALALKISRDDRNAALALTRGRVQLLVPSKSKGMQLLLEKKISGEALDVAVSSGAEAVFAVLSTSRTLGQRIVVFQKGGKIYHTARLETHVEQIELSEDGKLLAVYGNGPRGQNLMVYDVSVRGLALKWSWSNPRYADYASSLTLTRDRVLVGLESSVDESRESHLLVFGPEGALLKDFPLQTSEGTYLYTHAYSPDRSIVAVGTDDGTLGLYSLLSPGTR